MVEVKRVEVKRVEVNRAGVTSGARGNVTAKRSAATRFTIGEISRRSGTATSALRFYEAHGLIASERNSSGHRRYRTDVIRRVSFIRTAQLVGLRLAEIAEALASLPNERTPTARDWSRLAASWKPRLTERIETLTRLRDQLDECIGCGCLSLTSCGLWNPDDVAGESGTGPRYLLSDDRPVRPNRSAADVDRATGKIP